ncbi:MAG: acetate--CoA ligase [Nanoarchaeota archaeon]|nr:acetate--CoA ligase [Nanoarchaeota archaeon]MBU1632503.1 acetate--CoA ligase [Nanoarchaeota archaeon]MBU1876707.1 acetate--CoA ligase [Nanoarchaeota archaeon]
MKKTKLKLVTKGLKKGIKKGKKDVYWPTEELKKNAWINKKSIYKKAEKDPLKFWESLAAEGIIWDKKWKKTYSEKYPYFQWFIEGKLNVSYNCIDRHLQDKKNKAAIIWEPDSPEEKNRVLTYHDLYYEVNKLANVLKNLGVKKGDVVGIYLPMIPEGQISMLACSRIGAVHNVVFSAFSAESLKYRLKETGAKILITADGYYRKGKVINLKAKADEAVKKTKVKKVIVINRAGIKIDWNKKRDFWWHELKEKADSYCQPQAMDSEDTLFILYTSGTTGKPKGIIHTTGGYLTQAHWTAKWDFNLHDDDILWSTSDIGWITGHTYCCYGPLSNGATILIYEGMLNYPQPDRWCKIIEKYGITVFYTSPTAIRMFAKNGDYVKKINFASLRILGSVGEPINKEAWEWFFQNVGKKRSPLIDTWWQTETGGTMINSLPGIGPFIPTLAGRSFPGIRLAILDDNGKVLPANKEGNLVQLSPFAPGMLRGIYKNHKKYLETYWNKFGKRIYFTSDGAWKDCQGNFRIIGRLDDIIKIAGHRISTAELEDAITKHHFVAECAVIPLPHEIKGNVPIALVVLKKVKPSLKLIEEIIKQAEKFIGPIARPDQVFFVEDLPKTRSGKIMRRILKNILTNQPVEDISTLANPESVENIKKILRK